MDAYQLSRNNAFGPYASKYDRGIEIGPSYRPTFPKALGYQVTVIDHCSAPDLVEKYKNIPFIPEELVAQIEPVDIVWTGSTYRDLPGLIGAADYVAACHVIEHARDVCGFLKDCSALLQPGGVLLLAVPDSTCVQDYYRPASTVGDVLLAHVAPNAYDLKSKMDETWYHAHLDGGLAWSAEHLAGATKAGRVPIPLHPVDVSAHVWATTTADSIGSLADQPYRDAHRWVFDTENFSEIVSFLEVTAKTGLHLEAMPERFGCEFYAVLRKVTAEVETLQESRLRALRARDRHTHADRA